MSSKKGLSVLFVILFLYQIHAIGFTTCIDKIVASVNGNPITLGEVYLHCAIKLAIEGKTWNNECPSVEESLYQRIDDLLMLQEAHRLNLDSEEELEIESSLQTFRSLYAALYDLLLQSFGMTPEDLNARLKEQFEIQRFESRHKNLSFHTGHQDVVSRLEKNPDVYQPSHDPEAFETTRNFLIESQTQEQHTRWLTKIRKRAKIQILEIDFRLCQSFRNNTNRTK